jgi:hypothetical protein
VPIECAEAGVFSRWWVTNHRFVSCHARVVQQKWDKVRRVIWLSGLFGLVFALGVVFYPVHVCPNKNVPARSEVH